MPAFPCLSRPSFTTPTSLSRPAVPVSPLLPTRSPSHHTCHAISTLTDLTTLFSPNRSSPAASCRCNPHPTSPKRSSPAVPVFPCPAYQPLPVPFRLACHASSTCPCHSPPHRSSPLQPVPSYPHHSLPATTNPARPRRSPPTCIRHSVPATPCLSVLSRPVFSIRCLACLIVPVRTSPVQSNPVLSMPAMPVIQRQIIRNLVQQIVLNQVFPLQFQLAYQL